MLIKTNFIFLFLFFPFLIFSNNITKEKYNKCVSKFNTCRKLLVRTSNELKNCVEQLDNIKKEINELKKDTHKLLSKTYFPMNFQLLGFYSPLKTSVALGFQILSLQPLNLKIISNLGLHINTGYDNASLSISYSLRDTTKFLSHSKIHFIYGISYDFKFKTTPKLIGIGFSLDF